MIDIKKVNPVPVPADDIQPGGETGLQYHLLPGMTSYRVAVSLDIAVSISFPADPEAEADDLSVVEILEKGDDAYDYAVGEYVVVPTFSVYQVETKHQRAIFIDESAIICQIVPTAVNNLVAPIGDNEGVDAEIIFCKE